jgi:hypothetical protein
LQQFSNQQKEFAKTIEADYTLVEDDEDDTSQQLGILSFYSSLLLSFCYIFYLTFFEEAVCILCREPSPLYSENKPLGAIMSIQRSKIISLNFLRKRKE